LIYRGIREAANAARSIEERERGRRVADLRSSLRDRAVYVDYHPIVVTETQEIFGYARSISATLRSFCVIAFHSLSTSPGKTVWCSCW